MHMKMKPHTLERACVSSHSITKPLHLPSSDPLGLTTDRSIQSRSQGTTQSDTLYNNVETEAPPWLKDARGFPQLSEHSPSAQRTKGP